MLPHDFFRTMADETRLRCLLLLGQHTPLCVQQLVAALDEPQPKISRHLAQMRTCGVLSTSRRGQWVFYSIADDLPGWMRKITETLAESSCLQSAYKKDAARLKEIAGKPCC